MRIITRIALLVLSFLLLLSFVGCSFIDTQQETQQITQQETQHIHQYGAWVTLKDATCTETGQKERLCSCGQKEIQTIPIVEHHYINNVCDMCGKTKASNGLEYTLINSTYTVTGIGSCKDSMIVIPKEYNGKPVTTIGKDAFRGKAINNVVIPGSITSIESGAFSHCDLESVIIPASVIDVGDSVFDFCKKLKNVTFLGKVKNFGKCMFYGCSALEDIILPSGIFIIGESTFESCDSLTSITIPEGVFSIDEFAFAFCKNLSSITLPSTLVFIWDYAFADCYHLHSIQYQGSESQWSHVIIYADHSTILKAKVNYITD